MQNFDAIVIGAGAMGSATAYYLAKAGQRVLLLEQFELDHRKGSSYGQSRIIRYAYDHPVYVKLAQASFPAWKAIEEESGETLYARTGGFDFGTPGTPSLDAFFACLDNAEIPHEKLTRAEAAERFPQFQLDEGMVGLYQADAGIMAASKCVLTHIRLAKQYGATVLDQTPVTKITAHQNSVEVQTANETYTAGRLVLTAGAWMKRLLSTLGLDLPLTILRCQPCYFEGSPAEDYCPGKFPIFIGHLQPTFGRATYGLPDYLGSGLKIAFHGGQRCDAPSQINYTPDVEEEAKVRAFLHRHIPGAANGRMVDTQICLYTNTPDEHFIIDRHPEYPHIAIGSPCSGHGFKFSTVIGSILSDLALKGETTHDISLFNLSRFDSPETLSKPQFATYGDA